MISVVVCTATTVQKNTKAIGKEECKVGFRNSAYCKCWEVRPGQGNFTKVRLSTSRKNKDTGEYEQDFSGYVMMIGQAHAKSQKLKEGDRIRLGDVDVTTTYNKEQKKEYVNYKCFDFSMADDNVGQSANAGRVDANPVEGDNDVDEEPPF